MILVRVRRRGHSQVESYRLHTFPASIGRSVQNEIVLYEDTVSAKHAQIELRAEQLVLEDLESTNGIHYQGKRYPSLVLKSGDRVEIGDFQLEFLFDEADLSKTREISMPREVTFTKISLRKQWTLAGISILLLTFANSLDFYLNMGIRQKVSEWLTDFLTIASVSAGITVVVVLLSKIQTRHYQILYFFAVTNFFMAALFLVNSLMGTVLFNLRYPLAQTVMDYGLTFAYFYLLIYCILRALFQFISKKKVRLISVAVVVVLICALEGFVFLRRLDSAHYNYIGSIGYPLFPIREKTYPVSKTLEGINDHFERVDRFRQKALE